MPHAARKRIFRIASLTAIGGTHDADRRAANTPANLILIDGTTNDVSLRPVPLHSSFVTVNPVNNRVYVSNSNDATVTIIQE